MIVINTAGKAGLVTKTLRIITVGGIVLVIVDTITTGSTDLFIIAPAGRIITICVPIPVVINSIVAELLAKLPIGSCLSRTPLTAGIRTVITIILAVENATFIKCSIALGNVTK